MNIRVKRLTDSARLPVRGSRAAAGYDLFADISSDVHILPHETKMISTGLAMEIPAGYFGGIFARSGLAAKEGLRPANCCGVVDSDYRGPVIVALHNDSDTPRVILPEERIAQLVILPFLPVSFEDAEELADSERGEGGFGSTGKG